MSFFGDIGRIAREVKNISDEFTTIKNDVVAQTKDLKNQAHDVETAVKNDVKDVASTTKGAVAKTKQHLKIK